MLTCLNPHHLHYFYPANSPAHPELSVIIKTVWEDNKIKNLLHPSQFSSHPGSWMVPSGSWWSPKVSQSLDPQTGKSCRDDPPGGEAALGQEPHFHAC